MLKAGDRVIVESDGFMPIQRVVAKVTKDGKKAQLGKKWFVLGEYNQDYKATVREMTKEEKETFNRHFMITRIALNLADCPLEDEDVETLVEVMRKYKGDIDREIIDAGMKAAATPKKKGRWLPDASGYGFWVCSCCKFPSEASGANILYKFCPNCGTPMEGDEHGN